MKKWNLTVTVFTLAVCSIVYELILAQALSMFLHNTVLRYCVTIGIYLFAVGFGALYAEGSRVEKPLEQLQVVELFLSILGGFGVILLFFLEELLSAGLIFSFMAHALVLLIGFLSGFEIPLLMKLAESMDEEYTENRVLAGNYCGAFIGSVLFAAVLFPYVGLVTSALAIGILNAGVGLVFTYSTGLKFNKTVWLFQFIIIVILGYYYLQADTVSGFLIGQYIKS